jgi:division protein CdvB (Snf7/Vps24/ESCRT-III family)
MPPVMGCGSQGQGQLSAARATHVAQIDKIIRQFEALRDFFKETSNILSTMRPSFIESR